MQIRLKEPRRHRAVLIDMRPGTDPFLECMFGDRGIMLVGTYGSLKETLLVRSLPECDLMIVYLNDLTEVACRLLSELTERFDKPLMLLTENDEPERVNAAIVAGADSVLCVGASSDRLRNSAITALAMHERIGSYKVRASDAERALSERKLIERAKGILMQQRGISEPDALRELQRSSMQRNEPLHEVSKTIIAAKELLG
ncbi:MAG: ANTAR domain-containing protein [Pseudomonadota bacterium]